LCVWAAIHTHLETQPQTKKSPFVSCSIHDDTNNNNNGNKGKEKMMCVCPPPSPAHVQTQMDLLARFRSESLASNQSVWFGHYTTSTVVSTAPGLREVMR